jgi:DNA-directed RNA polymerase subunit K/omega
MDLLKSLAHDQPGSLPTWVTDPEEAIPQPWRYMGLTRFEQAVVVGRRALQLSQGAAPRVAAKVPNDDPVLLAMEELKCNNLPPMRVFRYLPDGACFEVEVHRANTAHHVRSRPW